PPVWISCSSASPPHLQHGTSTPASVSRFAASFDPSTANLMSSKLKSSYLFASKKAFANPGGVIARKSASVSGCAHASCGINFCADLCRYAKFGFPRPGLVYNGNLLGTSSQCLYTFGGGVNVPHKSVRFVH